jgi:hypothetical protein
MEVMPISIPGALVGNIKAQTFVTPNANRNPRVKPRRYIFRQQTGKSTPAYLKHAIAKQ